MCTSCGWKKTDEECVAKLLLGTWDIIDGRTVCSNPGAAVGINLL